MSEITVIMRMSLDQLVLEYRQETVKHRRFFLYGLIKERSKKLEKDTLFDYAKLNEVLRL